MSDIICPWCFVGKKRLEKAINETNTTADITLTYAPHLLYADIPAEGRKTTDFPRKHGMGSLLHQAGEDVGITFDFKSIKSVPNTLSIHYLLANLSDDHAAWKVKGALFEAYFTKGTDLTDHDIVEQIVTTCGYQANWDVNPLVEDRLTANRNHGISVVPTFVINDEHNISGAQESGRWEKFLLRSLNEQS